MKEISINEQQTYIAGVEASAGDGITSASATAKDLMNEESTSSLEVETDGEFLYNSAQVDDTKPNNHKWHGWGTASVSGQQNFGGAVRTVLLSGSHAELKALDVDSVVTTDDLNVGHTIYANNLGVQGTLLISDDISEEHFNSGSIPNSGLYIDETKEENHIHNLEVVNLTASKADFESGSFGDLEARELRVTESTTLSGSTVVTGTLNVDGPSYFQTNSLFRQDVHVEGNLYVEGTASYINSDELYIEDRSITVASGALNPEDADGAGFDIDGAGVEFHYDAQTDHMTLNKSLEILGTGSIIAPSGSINNLTSQYITVETASGYFTGSFVGDASGLTGLTMSISDAPKCKHVLNLIANESMTITHPFKTQNVLVQVYKWADPSFQPDYQSGAEGIHAGGEDEVPASVWDEPAIQVTDATIKVRPVTSSDPQDPYCVEISYPTDLHGYVVIADAGLYVSGSGYVDIVEATREVKWFGDDGGLNIIPSGSVEPDAEFIEKGESYRFQHSLGTKNVLVQVYRYYPRVNEDTQEIEGWTPVQIYPEFIAINDINEIEIKFSTDPEEEEESELPQYFGYIVIAKAGSVVKSFEISEDDIEHFNIHWGDSGSWSAREFNIETAYIESASIGIGNVEELTVERFIDAPKIGNLNTGEQYYHDYYNEKLWGSYMEFTDHGIASYVRNYGETDDETPEGYNIDDARTILTASLLDGKGDLYLRGGLITNHPSFGLSDAREKHNIKTLEDAVEKLNKIRGVSFNWNNGDAPGIGVIAQEIQAIYPELTREVTKFDGEQRLVVNYDGLIGVLIEAVKTLSHRVEELENKIKQ